MATAFTSLLGLALPVTGELAGTWGTTINDSITSLLDSAVSGTTTLSTDADVTLTTTTGAANQARQAILLCSGARTALRTITAPAQSKLYVVINSTTGGFGVKIVGVGPTTGVTVAAGKTAVVVWNGSDFVEISNAPILIGGTGTTSTLTLRSTSGVGTTGADIIFQTGNNGATEAMRVLNSGALLVGTTAQTVSETVSITGATNTSSSGAYPCLIAAVDNRAYNSATPSPGGGITFGYKYNVGGSITLGPSIQGFKENTTDGDFAGALKFLTRINGASPSEVMRITSAGNLGIGTNAPTTKLDVNGTVRAYGGIYSANQSVTAFSASIGSNWTNRLIAGSDAGGSPFFAIQVASDASNGSTERFRIDSTGNVGIGAGAPEVKLQVVGSGLFSGDNNYLSADAGAGVVRLGFFKKSGLYPVIAAGSTSPIVFGHTDGASIQTPSTAVFTERMRIDTAGNMGVGTASPGSYGKLAVVGTIASLTADTANIGSLATSAGVTSLSAYNATGAALTFNTATTGGVNTERMRITSAGNVGIGTTTPGSPLTIGTATSVPLLINGQTTGASYISITNTGGTYVAGVNNSAGSAISGGLAYSALVGSNSATALQLTTNGTARLTVDSAGNVGIGTTTIGSPLTVYAGNNQATIKVTNGPSANNVGITLESTGGNVVLNNGNGPFELSTGGSIRATLSTAGNLGLGITPSAWASGWTALQVRQGAMWSDSSARTFLSNNLYFDGTDRRYVLNGVAHEMVLDSGGSYIWKQAASGVAGAAISFTQAMTLAASGNLGIGTAAPAQLLHIASGDATALIENTAATSNATLQLKYPSRTWALANRGSDLSGSFAIRDTTAGADRLVINTTGNLLIGGTTPIGVARVELIGTNDATSQISLYRSDLTQRLTIGSQYIATVTNTALDFYTNSTQRMRLAASGQLLLGTSTGSAIAQNYIDINGTANCALVLKATDVVQGYVYADDASDEFRLSATGTGNINALTFFTGGLERARITSAGNVGIGTSTPAMQLDVRGVSTTSGASRRLIYVSDTSATAAGVGGGIAFAGYIDGASTVASFGGVQAQKENATAGNQAGYLSLNTNNGIALTERMRIDSAGNVGIGTTTPVNALQVNGSFGRNAPVTKTTSFTLAATENWLICNGTATITVTLPAASSWTGREVMIKNIAAFTVVSASSNVVPLAGGAAGTAILPATAGAWATLVSDGTNWIIMQS